MRVRLLKDSYFKEDTLYEDFLKDNIRENVKYISNEVLDIERDLPVFPVYMATGAEKARKEDFLEAFEVIENHYLGLDREILMSQKFWHSLLLIHFRDYLLEKYPQIKKSPSEFNRIVVKKFDWENYIYKALLAVQYVLPNTVSPQKAKYYRLIIDNLDVFNYIIKYKIFRNDIFLLRVLDIIDKNDLSKELKAEIHEMPGDERFGRRVIFEMNKEYPVIMSPMLDNALLEEIFLNHLHNYQKKYS